MRIVDGPNATDYEEILRSIGALFDERGWRDVALIEIENTVVIQVMLPATSEEARPELVTYVLTADDIDLLTRAGVAARRARSSRRTGAGVVAGEIAPAPPALEDTGTPATPPSGEPSRGRLVAFEPDSTQDARRIPARGDTPARVLPFDPRRPHGSRLAPVAPARAVPDAAHARAAVVMAGIVAAKLRSGARLGADDPDLTSLLEQVRALDVEGIGS